jgi:hypothetical protein
MQVKNSLTAALRRKDHRDWHANPGPAAGRCRWNAHAWPRRPRLGGGNVRHGDRQGGALSISVPVSAGNLGTRENTVSGGTISGQLGEVQVSDARDAAAGSGWVATVISTAFTPLAGGPTIGAVEVGYNAGAITKVGTATFTANNPINLTGVVAAVTATGITGDNSATWDPTINVFVAGGMAAGVYAGTITQSVS